MASRDETFAKFGPMLFEATLEALIERSNEIRRAQNIPEITMQDITDEINTRIDKLEPYDWPDEE